MLFSNAKLNGVSSSIRAKKSAVLLLTSLLFLGALIGAINIQVSGTITIQGLIDAASPGDIINVPSGTYYENIIVNKEVSLIGANNENTIIVGSGSGHTVKVEANNAVISGFTIKNSGGNYPDSGVFLDLLENVQITNNIVTENNGFGVFVTWGTNNLIANNTIIDNGWPSNAAGIRVDGMYSPAKVANNTIINNPQGVFVYLGHDVLVSNNTLTSNDAGIEVQGDSRYVVLKNNTIDMSSTYGIEFYDSYESTIENNTVTNTAGNGVVIEGGSAFLALKDNNIYDNLLNGLTIRDGAANNDVSSNLITANHEKGVEVFGDCLYNRLTENTITLNYQDGIYLNQASYVMIRGNVITNNLNGGINAISSVDSGIIQNQITDNSFGIELGTSSRISIVENYFARDNTAVSLLSSDGCWVTKNNFVENNIVGIFLFGPVGGSANNNLVGNEFDNNNVGIKLENSQSNVIRANTLANSYGDGGLCVTASSGSNLITQNNFVGNSLHVFVSADSASNNFDGNYWDNYSAPPPHIINATLGVQDNSPLDNLWVYNPVHNTATDLYYSTIQDAIDDGATSDGDVITVENGVFHENVNVWRSVQLIGTSPQGTLIDGNQGDVLSVSPGTTNVVVQNFAITNGGKGIFLYETQNAIINNNFVYSNDVFGIHEDLCSGVFIVGNRVVNSRQDGVYISGSSFPPLATNFLEYNYGNGIVLIDDTESTLLANSFTRNMGSGLYSDMDCDKLMIFFNWLNQNWINGFTFAHTTDSIIAGNVATENYYGIHLFECSNMSLLLNAAMSNGGVGIYLTQSNNSNVISNSITQSDQGLQLESSSNNNITQNIISDNNNIGILLGESTHNNIKNNNSTNNRGDGIQLTRNACNNTVGENAVLQNSAEGIRLLETSIHNVIVNNTVTGSGGDGIGLESHSSQNDIINNYVKDSNWYGIHPHGGQDSSDHITGINIVGNTLENNGVGVVFTNAWNSRVFHNNFIDNRDYQLAIEETCSGNAWDDGYPSGGNYWNDYSGVDQYHGSAQNLVGSDGIGDTAYPFNVPLNFDNYPLFNLFNPTELMAASFTSGGQPIPIVITTNVTITATGSTPGALNFTVTGPSGETGYVRAIIPVGANNTNLKVFVDGAAVASPFPIIETNSTHYFVYTEFTLSTHEILFVFVLPEYFLGGLLALASCFAAFSVYTIRKKHVGEIKQ